MPDKISHEVRERERATTTTTVEAHFTNIPFHKLIGYPVVVVGCLSIIFIHCVDSMSEFSVVVVP